MLDAVLSEEMRRQAVAGGWEKDENASCLTFQRQALGLVFQTLTQVGGVFVLRQQKLTLARGLQAEAKLIDDDRAFASLEEALFSADSAAASAVRNRRRSRKFFVGFGI